MKEFEWRKMRTIAGFNQKKKFAAEIGIPYRRYCDLESGRVTADEKDLRAAQAFKSRRIREGLDRFNKTVPESKTMGKVRRQLKALLTDIKDLKPEREVVDVHYLLMKLEGISKTLTDYDETKIAALEKQEATLRRRVSDMQKYLCAEEERLVKMREEAFAIKVNDEPLDPFLWLEAKDDRALVFIHVGAEVCAYVIPQIRESFRQEVNDHFCGFARGPKSYVSISDAYDNLKNEVA